MKKYQNSLLAGVAALALVAGSGLAMAQQSNEHTGGAMGGSKGASAPAGQSMNHQSMGRQGMQPQAQSKGPQTQAQDKGSGTQNQAQEQGKTNANQTAQTGNKGSASPTGHQAGNTMGRHGTSSSARAEHMNRGSRNNRQNTAQQQRTLKGLQGNASQNANQQGSTAGSNGNGSNQAQQQPQNNMQRGSENARVNGGGTQARGGNVQLSEQQRTQIRTTVINGHNAPRVGSVDFDVRVGTVIPRGRIHIVPVPETLVRIEPRWRGFLYFVYQDEVVIVNPHNYHIVAVVAA